MTWARFDDGFPHHPKVIGLSDQAFRLHVSAVCYSNANLTDGVIHGNMLPLLLPGRPAAGIKRRAEELVDGNVWERADDGCYAIHDFHIYNKSRSEVMAERKAKSMAGAKGGASRWHRNGNAPVPDPVPVDPDPLPTDLPLTPSGEGERAERARKGSKRKRDVIALKAEQANQTPEERFLGKERATVFKARAHG